MVNSQYTKNVMDHFLHPKNFREIKKPDAIGEVGNMKCGDVSNISKTDYDLIVANITADVLIENFDKILANQCKVKNLILSGISDHRRDDMDDFLISKGLVPEEVRYKDNWYTYWIKDPSAKLS